MSGIVENNGYSLQPIFTRRINKKRLFTCPAFDNIPVEIIFGNNHHNTKLLGQKMIYYSKRNFGKTKRK